MRMPIQTKATVNMGSLSRDVTTFSLATSLLKDLRFLSNIMIQLTVRPSHFKFTHLVIKSRIKFLTD